jgi:peroxiredoxin
MSIERQDPTAGGPPSPPPEHRARHPFPAAGRRLLGAALAAGLISLATSPALAQKRPPPPPPGGTQPQTGTERAPGVRFSGRLMIGDPGPEFALIAADGRTFALRSLRDHEAAAVVFLQRANMFLAGYAAIGDSLSAQGIRLIFVCQQTLPKEHKGWHGIEIVHDRQGEVARQYGAFDLISEDTVPAVYLLDAKGKVRYFAVGRLPNPGELQAISIAVLAPDYGE